jgi:protein tyrosine/serine phosphatase
VGRTRPCIVGIDRTGFLSAILESLMDAQLDEIAKDYMLSFVDENEYALNDSKNGILFLTNLFTKISGETFTTNNNLKDLTMKYLKEKIKLNDTEILVLENKLNWSCSETSVSEQLPLKNSKMRSILQDL